MTPDPPVNASRASPDTAQLERLQRLAALPEEDVAAHDPLKQGRRVF